MTRFLRQAYFAKCTYVYVRLFYDNFVFEKFKRCVYNTIGLIYFDKFSLLTLLMKKFSLCQFFP